MAINPGYTRRTELSCTLEEMAAYGAVILYQNEAIYIKQDDGRYAVKIGDGKTPLADLPYSVHYGEFAALKAAAENAKKLAEDARTAAEAAQAGAAEVISATNFANSLKGYKSGTAVFMDDVSPVEHEMVVNVKSKNLLDIEGHFYKNTNGCSVSVEDNGITLTKNEENEAEPNSYYDMGDYSQYIGKNLTLSFILNRISTGDKGIICYLYYGYPVNDSDAVGIVAVSANLGHVGVKRSAAVTVPEKPEGKHLFVRVYFYGGKVAGSDAAISELQVEEGTNVTTYAPYVDVSTVKVIECGKNLLNVANTKSSNGRHEIGADGVITLTNDASVYKGRMIWELGSYDEFVGKTLTFSFAQLEAPAGGNIAYFYADYNTGNGLVIQSAVVEEDRRTTLTTKNIPANTGGWSKLHVVYYVDKFTTEGQIAKIKELQVELGTATTEYEPYVERKEHNSDADGAVKGIVGKGEDMTLYTDTAVALVECKYNRDINKAFAKLQQALISLGGNV